MNREIDRKSDDQTDRQTTSLLIEKSAENVLKSILKLRLGK